MFFNYELFRVETRPLHVFMWWLVPGSSDPDCCPQTGLQPVYYLFIEKHLRTNNPHGFLQYLCVSFLEDTDYGFFQRLPTKSMYLKYTQTYIANHVWVTAIWIRCMLVGVVLNSCCCKVKGNFDFAGAGLTHSWEVTGRTGPASLL